MSLSDFSDKFRMKKTENFGTLLGVLLLSATLISCQTPAHRNPSSVDVPPDVAPYVQKLYSDKLQAELNKERLQILKRRQSTPHPHKKDSFPQETREEREYKEMNARQDRQLQVVNQSSA